MHKFVVRSSDIVEVSGVGTETVTASIPLQRGRYLVTLLSRTEEFESNGQAYDGDAVDVRVTIGESIPIESPGGGPNPAVVAGGVGFPQLFNREVLAVDGSVLELGFTPQWGGTQYATWSQAFYLSLEKL